MTNLIKSRISSNRADSLTVSQLLQITFVVVIVIYVGQKLYRSISSKADAVANCIDDSNNLFTGDGSACMESSGEKPQKE